MIHGTTKHGHVIHVRTLDHLPATTQYERFNKAVATWITSRVGTMTCAYLFAVLGLTATYGAFTGDVELTLIAGSISGYFLQLVLLPTIIVGQNLQAAASDVRATKQFEDVEVILDRLDTNSEGGLKTLVDLLGAIQARLDAIMESGGTTKG